MEVRLTDAQAKRIEDMSRAIDELVARRSAMLGMVWPDDSPWTVDVREDGIYLVPPPEPASE
jgi:hypothetical protein